MAKRKQPTNHGKDETKAASQSNISAEKAEEQLPKTMPDLQEAASHSEFSKPDKTESISTEADSSNHSQRQLNRSDRRRQVVSKEQGPVRNAIIRHRRLSTLQRVLIIGIILIETILLYIVFRPKARQEFDYEIKSAAPAIAVKEPVNVEEKPSDVEKEDEGSETKVQPPTQITSAVIVPEAATSFSLKTAETLYLQKDFKKAYAIYDQLRQNLSSNPQDDSIRNFLQLKMAFCLKNAGDAEQANNLFLELLQSRFPVIKIAVNYHQCMLLMHTKQYLKARAKAYQVIALIDAVDWSCLGGTSDGLGNNWALQLIKDCHFLVAECLTKEVLSLCDADKNLPSELWCRGLKLDPFMGFEEAGLRSFLDSGSNRLSRALLAPDIQAIGGEQKQGSVARWEFACCGASIEELFARFVSNTDFDIGWGFELDKALRNRPISLYMSAATAQQFITVAAGCAGLMARFDEEKIINIYNPLDYNSLSEHIALLCGQAISLWQKYLLTFSDDARVPNAHFLTGLLQAQQGQFNDAIAEYKLTANRYSQTSIAPFALFNSSKLKVGLRDYFGAKEDLKQLVEQFPDSRLYEQACLYLADVTKQTGALQEAARLYQKVYNLSLSLESQRASILGAGKCFFEKKDYENAAKCLAQFVNLAEDRTDRDFCSCCFLLGKAYLELEKYEQACQAFQCALTDQLPMQEYVETISALVKTHIRRGSLGEALILLESRPVGTHARQVTQEESIEISLLKASVLRSMSMYDEAIAALGDAAQYLPNSQLKARVFFEQGKSLIGKGDLEAARKSLSQILVFIAPGPLSCEVRCELAGICLKLGEYNQVVSICLQFLSSESESVLRQQVLDMLAKAYTCRKDYDKAALVLMGRWGQDEGIKTKIEPEEKQGNEDAISQNQAEREARLNEG
jgi:tetratricopeptide (TPR) repeat protein